MAKLRKLAYFLSWFECFVLVGLFGIAVIALVYFTLENLGGPKQHLLIAFWPMTLVISLLPIQFIKDYLRIRKLFNLPWFQVPWIDSYFRFIWRVTRPDRPSESRPEGRLPYLNSQLIARSILLAGAVLLWMAFPNLKLVHTFHSIPFFALGLLYFLLSTKIKFGMVQEDEHNELVLMHEKYQANKKATP